MKLRILVICWMIRIFMQDFRPSLSNGVGKEGKVMKKFNLMVMKDVEVPGVGYYQSVSDGLRIEAEDYAVKEFFMSAIRNKTFISGIREHTSELQSRGHLVCRLLLE